ncbi:hypothetical protein ABK040_008001 [Willaertia magna]
MDNNLSNSLSVLKELKAQLCSFIINNNPVMSLLEAGIVCKIFGIKEELTLEETILMKDCENQLNYLNNLILLEDTNISYETIGEICSDKSVSQQQQTEQEEKIVIVDELKEFKRRMLTHVLDDVKSNPMKIITDSIELPFYAAFEEFKENCKRSEEIGDLKEKYLKEIEELKAKHKIELDELKEKIEKLNKLESQVKEKE